MLAGRVVTRHISSYIKSLNSFSAAKVIVLEYSSARYSKKIVLGVDWAEGEPWWLRCLNPLTKSEVQTWANNWANNAWHFGVFFVAQL